MQIVLESPSLIRLPLRATLPKRMVEILFYDMGHLCSYEAYEPTIYCRQTYLGDSG